MLSKNTDNKGSVTFELAMGSYEVKVEKYGLSKVCELVQDDSVLLLSRRSIGGKNFKSI
jgi:hypothetical protein